MTRTSAPFRPLFVTLSLASLFALAASACAPLAVTDPDAGVLEDGGSIDGPASASEYCERIEPFFCDFYLRCGRMAGVTTTAECRAVFQEQCNATYEPRYLALESAGLLALSEDGIEACRLHLEEVSCEEQIRDLDGRCGGMWIGKQETGGACGFDVESLVCEPGSACSLGLDFCGECRPLAGDGEACGADTEEPVSCGSDASCDERRCVARVPVGEACAPEDRCVIGARCEGGVCRAPNYVEVGEGCDQVNRCPYKAHCEAGFCAEDVLLDESCAQASCASGWCGADEICKALLTAGSACASSAQCSSGLCLEGQCRELPGPCFD